jgi:mannose-1-phosphate guanylyltransferase/mannose-6-phosphate isomerase
MSVIIPIILSGGSGTRLWPLSRASKPKQFLNFGTRNTLFQNTVLRCRSDIFDARPIVVGAEAHRFLIAEDLLEIGVSADILLEPAPRNSCAAIAAGCLAALSRCRDALVLVLAADHHIPDAAAFSSAAAAGTELAGQGMLVTFGIRPSRPSTAYGYIRPGAALGAAMTVEAFVEKPSEAEAVHHIASGCLWNSGNFLFRADVFMDELERLQPEIGNSVRASFDGAARDLDFLRLAARAFAESPSISVDYAVMEKTDKSVVLPVDYEWSDVGSWSAVRDVLEQDAHGNAVIGEAAIIDGSNNLVHSAGILTTLVGIEDAVVVSTRDCVLVVSRERTEDVKGLVARLKADGRVEADEDLQMFRPWGNYERLDIGTGYQVKRIVVKPGGALSLQKHRHRAEHWVVVEGEAEVTVDQTIRTIAANESIYVPVGSVHRLVNRTAKPVVLIEVQTGSYFGEDDIIRLEDCYNRVAQAEA